MNDVLNLDEASNYDLVLFELITYKKAAAPTYQYHMRFFAERHFLEMNIVKEDGSTVLFRFELQ